jgi:serine/threonine protein kinase
MDRASSVSLDFKLQQMAVRRRVPGLGKQLAYRVMKDVMNGLIEMHGAGWAYLDLKPANIVGCNFVLKGQPDSEDTIYSLVDFGSSQRVGTSSPHLIPYLPGTPAYMSPEWAHSSFVGPKADIWALGILLLELRGG